MAHKKPRHLAIAGTIVVLVATIAIFLPLRRVAAADPLAAEISRLSSLLLQQKSTGETWLAAREQATASLASTRQALEAGKRLLALERLMTAREAVLSAVYLVEQPAERRQNVEALEAEWKRIGSLNSEFVAPPTPESLAKVRSAAARALAEVALSQAREYYAASLDYGRNTEPASGFYYLGAAAAQLDFAKACGGFAPLSGSAPPPLRSLAGEIDAVERDLLTLYRPPASIDNHRAFITASARLKEARELNDRGLRYGAMLRYLQAVQQVSAIGPAAPNGDAGDLAGTLAEMRRRTAAGNVDHTIGQLLVEEADADLSSAGREHREAAVILGRVLPSYFAALEPAAVRAPGPSPVLTVTLVRWPYT